MQNAGDILERLLGGALGDVDGAAAVKEMNRNQALADEAQRLAEIKIVTDVIDANSEAGARFLQWLAHKTILWPSDDMPNATTGAAIAFASGKDTGRKQIFFLVMEVLRAAAVRPAVEPEKKPSKRRKRKGD